MQHLLLNKVHSSYFKEAIWQSCKAHAVFKREVSLLAYIYEIRLPLFVLSINSISLENV